MWGVIGELLVIESVRLVGEVNGESTRGRSLARSCVLGLIWKVRSIAIVGGVRRGLTEAAADSGFTLRLTFGFSTEGLFSGVREKGEG